MDNDIGDAMHDRRERQAMKDTKVMNVRDSHASLNNDKTVFTCPSGGLQIIADDGKTLFDISLLQGGAEIAIEAGIYCEHGGKRYQDLYVISPKASNLVYIRKLEYKP